ncbi:hypothetical protein [Aurantimonas sp. 22II-16-19i]|uniref:hypothetical protein n=1 Tax=Aurantimonas sp. 22II-16-19i TaxID=1317114 RepID=UPI00111C7A7E|nr:hypothetical protein [Aurantimonas sp. 22II-16-19i]
MKKHKTSTTMNEDEEVSEAEIRSFSSWKFDLLETVNADPKTSPADLAIMEAYLHFTRAKSRTAYLSALAIRIRTGIKSTDTITARRRRLVELGYLVPHGTTRTGIEVFEVVNARQNLVDEHVMAAQEKLREMDADRKRKDRARRRVAGDVPLNIRRTESARVPLKSEIAHTPCPPNKWEDVPPKSEDKHLKRTPVSGLGSEEGTPSKSFTREDYLRASRGC